MGNFLLHRARENTKEKTMIIGIDPGNEGAIATLSNRPARVRMMPTLKETKSRRVYDEQKIRQFLEQRKKAIQHVFIEKVGVRPGEGAVGAMSFGTGYGILRGICIGLHIPYTLVLPASWKRTICKGMNTDVKKSKQASIIIAKRLWPDISLLPTPRCKNESDGMADALCIAEYGRRTLMGQCMGKGE